MTGEGIQLFFPLRLSSNFEFVSTLLTELITMASNRVLYWGCMSVQSRFGVLCLQVSWIWSTCTLLLLHLLSIVVSVLLGLALSPVHLQQIFSGECAVPYSSTSRSIGLSPSRFRLSLYLYNSYGFNSSISLAVFLHLCIVHTSICFLTSFFSFTLYIYTFRPNCVFWSKRVNPGTLSQLILACAVPLEEILASGVQDTQRPIKKLKGNIRNTVCSI